MSEKRININPELPSGYEKLDGIEIIQKDNNNIRVNGVIELGEDGNLERRVKLPDLAEMWGYDPDKSLADWESRKADPERWEMAKRIERLEQQVSELATDNKTLKEDNKTLKEEIKSLQNPATSEPTPTPEPAPTPEPTPIPEPETDIDNEADTQEVAGFRRGDAVALLLEEIEEPEDAEYQSGYNVMSFVKDRDSGDDLIIIKDVDTNENFAVEPYRLLHDDDLDEPDEPVVRNSESRWPRRWNRTTGRLGNLMLGRQVAAHNGFFNMTDRRGRPIIIEEEIVDGYPESSLSAGNWTLGALAVGAAAGVFVWELLEHKFFGHGGKHVTEIINNNKGVIRAKNQEINDLTQALSKETRAVNNLAADVAALKTAEAKEHIYRSAEAANQIFVNPGHGYTQEIQDSFPGKSGGQYYQAYKSALHKFGKNFIQGIPKYRMRDGNWGLGRPGAAYWAPHVRDYLRNFFATR